MSIVGAGQYLMTGGWSFWPVGDFYQLEPKWEEWFSVSGNVYHTDDEPNRFELLAAYDGPEPFIVLQVTDLDSDLDVPSGTPAYATRAWKTAGFNEERELVVALVTDDLDVWNGKFHITFSDSLRKWAGPNRVLNWAFDFWTEEAPYNRVRLAYGKIVFRR